MLIALFHHLLIFYFGTKTLLEKKNVNIYMNTSGGVVLFFSFASIKEVVDSLLMFWSLFSSSSSSSFCYFLLLV